MSGRHGDAMRGKDFADLVYTVVVAEKRYRAEAVAAGLGLGYDAFYARIRNRIVFAADEIRALVEIAPDPRFVAYLAARDGVRSCRPGRPMR